MTIWQTLALIYAVLAVPLAVFALSACMLSSRISRQEERNPLYWEGGGR
jgi:cytochrome c oxidase subunit IV